MLCRQEGPDKSGYIETITRIHCQGEENPLYSNAGCLCRSKNENGQATQSQPVISGGC